MRAKLIIFPIRARNWCFSRSIDHSLPPPSSSASSPSPSSFKELWNNVNAADKSFNAKAELCTDYVADKMNNGWVTLERAPDGSLKKKIHGLGLWLLSRVKPSEIFLKSISKEVTGVEIVYPSSVNAQLVRRRLRHIAMRGTIVHRKFFYGSVSLIPLSSALSILPLPNVAFFWILYRSYSHWRALQGSEKLFQLVSNSSNSSITFTDKKGTEHNDSKSESLTSDEPHCILSPSEELEKLVRQEDGNDGLSRDTIAEICKLYDLNTKDVIKYENNAKKPGCFYPIPQAADCLSRVVERADAPIIYLSTDAAASETDLLKSLVVLNGKPVPLVIRPARNIAEKWDALLYRHHIEGDSQVEAMLDKTICAMSSVFIGAPGSTFTEDILRLRKDWGSASQCDEYLCQGEEPII